MKEFQDLLRREITREDIDKLVEKPVRKISKFDTKVLDEKIRGIEAEMAEVQNDIEHITDYTIEWFRSLRQKYGKPFVRQTEITAFETIAVTKVVSNNAKLYANYEEGFVGIGMKKDDNGVFICDCSDLSEIIVIGKDGKYRVAKVTDKAFFGKDLLYVGLFNRSDTRTIYNVIYREGKSSIHYAKRFAITSVTRDKEYDITTGEPGSKILWFTVNHNGEAETVRIYLRPRPNLKKSQLEYDFSTLAIKGKASRGNPVTILWRESRSRARESPQSEERTSGTMPTSRSSMMNREDSISENSGRRTRSLQCSGTVPTTRHRSTFQTAIRAMFSGSRNSNRTRLSLHFTTTDRPSASMSKGSVSLSATTHSFPSSRTLQSPISWS